MCITKQVMWIISLKNLRNSFVMPSNKLLFRSLNKKGIINGSQNHSFKNCSHTEWQFITPYQEQDKDNFIKERKKTQVGLYTKGAAKTQEVVLSEQFREFYYNCVVNQKVIFNYVHYTGKTEAELQAILNRVLATTKLISMDQYLIMYFPFSFCNARRVLMFGHSWFMMFECYILFTNME